MLKPIKYIKSIYAYKKLKHAYATAYSIERSMRMQYPDQHKKPEWNPPTFKQFKDSIDSDQWIIMEF